MTMPDNIEARVAVLEKLSENFDQQREDTNKRVERNEARLEAFEERFDEHLVANSNHMVRNSEVTTRLVTSVESIQQSIKQALEGSFLAVKHETIMQALLWMGAALVTVIGASWAVFIWWVK